MKFFNIFRKKIMADCGHKTFRTDEVSAFGETGELEIAIIDGKAPYCHRCLEKMTIRCAWCSEPIFIGQPITLYSLEDKDQKMPEYAVLYDKESNSYVGCVHCGEMADRAGFWYPPGEVKRVLTPIEMCLLDLQNGGDGIIYVNNLCDLNEAMNGANKL